MILSEYIAWVLQGRRPRCFSSKIHRLKRTFVPPLPPKSTIGPLRDGSLKKTRPPGARLGSSLNRHRLNCVASGGCPLAYGLATAPTNVQSRNWMRGLFGHADQLVVPTNVQAVQMTPSLSPWSAKSPGPELARNLQPRNRMSRTRLDSASISAPAPGALKRPERPVWLNSQSVKS